MKLTTNPAMTLYKGPPVKADTISASSLNTFLGCGLHWRLSKVDRLELAKPKHVALFFGGAVHKSLEPYWKGRTSIFRDTWARYQHTKMDFGNDRDSWLTYATKGSKMVAEIELATQGRFDSSSSLVELPNNYDFRFVKLLRYIDVLTDVKNLPILVNGQETEFSGQAVLDLKTSARVYYNDAAATSQQLMTYALKSSKPEVHPEMFIYVVVTKSLRPKVQLLGATYDQDDLMWHMKRIRMAIGMMRAGIFIQNKSQEACKWCDFKALCFKQPGWESAYYSKAPGVYDKDGRRIDLVHDTPSVIATAVKTKEPAVKPKKKSKAA